MRVKTFAAEMRIVLMMFFVAVFAGSAFAGGIQTLDVVDVTDTTENLVGTADSANEGTVPREEIQSIPYYRTGELLEVTPGLIVTQHSAEGKANQYFLRGVNLDHGTDLRITVDGMDVNERTNTHRANALSVLLSIFIRVPHPVCHFEPLTPVISSAARNLNCLHYKRFLPLVEMT